AGNQSLGALFPSTLVNDFQTLNGLTGQISLPVSTPFLNVAPGQSITMIFDVSAYAPPQTLNDFASTLAPSPTLPLFTDPDGNAVTQMVAVGPSVPVSTAPNSIVLSPSTASLPAGTTGSVTATVRDASNNPVSNAVVYFAFNSGPNAGPAGPVTTDNNGQAVFTYVDNHGAGQDTIQATVNGITATPVSITWTAPGPLDHIVVSPATATIASGGSQAYTAAAFDRFNNSIGDVTASTTFGITPDGSCTGASCTASVSGPHIVTGAYSGKTATVSLTVGATKTTPSITWATPAAINYGTPLSATQLNATASVAGTFSYTPGAGTVLSAGGHHLSVIFTPTDTTDYNTATANVMLHVNQATPAITWSTP